MSGDLLSIRNIGFVSTRICGTDGVSLEIRKWAEILERLGYNCFYIGGKSDRPADRTFLIDEMDFLHPDIVAITDQSFGRETRNRELGKLIQKLAQHIKDKLYDAFDLFQLDLLVAQNALTIPLNIPLGVALVELLIETGIACIAHHHDFAWERDRFAVNAVDDYLHAAFPPPLAEIDHVVINTQAGKEFSRRTGLPYRVIPNVMDFANPPPAPDDYATDFRQQIGLNDEDLFILQPTRMVKRKGIEHSIELIRRLNDDRCRLVITHDGNDEGDAYVRRIDDFSRLLNVPVIYASSRVGEQRGVNEAGEKQYAIWDVYPQADLVTYPSTYEGFGNAFLEAAFYKKPILCNRYTIFRSDIEPCGFRAITMDGFLTDDVIAQVRKVLTDRDYREELVEHNYKAAARVFSFERVECELQSLLSRPRPCPRRAE